jgi:hypothetical protein
VSILASSVARETTTHAPLQAFVFVGSHAVPRAAPLPDGAPTHTPRRTSQIRAGPSSVGLLEQSAFVAQMGRQKPSCPDPDGSASHATWGTPRHFGFESRPSEHDLKHSAVGAAVRPPSALLEPSAPVGAPDSGVETDGASALASRLAWTCASELASRLASPARLLPASRGARPASLLPGALEPGSATATHVAPGNFSQAAGPAEQSATHTPFGGPPPNRSLLERKRQKAPDAQSAFLRQTCPSNFGAASATGIDASSFGGF